MNYQDFITLAKKKGFTNIQITIETGISTEVYYINDALDDYSDISKTTYNIKGEYKGKIEQIYSEYLDESILELLIEKIKLTDSNYENEFLENRENEVQSANIEVTVKEEVDIIKKMHKLKNEYPSVKTIEFFYSDEYLKTQIVNNKGVNISTSSHVYKFSTEAVAEKNGESSSYNKSILVTDKTKINFKEMAKTVLEKVNLQVEKEKLETRKYNLVIDNSVITSIISSLKNMLSAQAIHKKISCLEGKLNEKIFSNRLTILEEPLNKDYPGYVVFDKEGVETRNKVLIENGILKTYLYDNKEAKIDNITSTGNNYGNISTRNMYIKPGSKTLEELLNKMKDGLYITDKMGAIGSSINESTGNISLQVFGFIVKDGKIIKGFVPAIMSTTIFEILSNIENIGSDLTFTTKEAGAPSIYVKDISIAAE